MLDRFIKVIPLILAVSAPAAIARDVADGFSFHGEIHTRGSWQSRESVADCCGLYDCLQAVPDYNRLGREMNDISSWNLADAFSRLSVNWGTFLSVGLRVDVKAEAELSYFRQNTSVNLGEAYFRLSKDSKQGRLSLLAGQDWHPMAKDRPDVISVYGEAPFNPYNLSPMIDFRMGVGGFGVELAAIGQGRFTSLGPSGRSTEYVRYGIPEILLQVCYAKGGITLKAGADYLSLKPTVRTTYLNVPMWTVSEADFFSFYAYAGMKIGQFSLQAKGMLTSGAEHLGTLGGYALSETYRGVQNIYTPYRTLTAWVNLTYGGRLKYGLFAGYIRNLGTAQPVADSLVTNVWYTEGLKTVRDVLRVAPSVRYSLGGGFTAGLEYEFTFAGFGSGAMEGNGLFGGDLTESVMNKVSASLSYTF